MNFIVFTLVGEDSWCEDVRKKKERAGWREAQRDPSLCFCAAAIRKGGSSDGHLPSMLHSTQRQERCDQSQASFMHTFFFNSPPELLTGMHTHTHTHTHTHHTHTYTHTHTSACSTLSVSHTQASRWPAEFVVMATHPSSSLLFLRCVLRQDFSLSLPHFLSLSLSSTLFSVLPVSVPALALHTQSC